MDELIWLLIMIIGIAVSISMLVWLISKNRSRATATMTSTRSPFIDVTNPDQFDSIQQARGVLDKLEEVALKPYHDFQERTQERTDEKIELRRKYEAKFGDWEEFEDHVKKRLYEAMSKPDLAQRVAEALDSDSISPDSLYLFAAEDILFHFGVSQMPGVEMVGLDTHDQWINHLLQNEYEQKVAVQESEQPIVSAVREGNMGNQDETIIRSIEEIARLRDKGILSDEEFQSKKAELLKRL